MYDFSIFVINETQKYIAQSTIIIFVVIKLVDLIIRSHI